MIEWLVIIAITLNFSYLTYTNISLNKEVNENLNKLSHQFSWVSDGLMKQDMTLKQNSEDLLTLFEDAKHWTEHLKQENDALKKKKIEIKKVTKKR